MSAKAREAFEAMAAEMDRREAECVATEDALASGETVSAAARRQYEQWEREGKPRWRETPAIVGRVRKAAKKAAKNARTRR